MSMWLLNPVTTVPAEPLDAEAAAAEEAQLIENSEPNDWVDPAYVELFPQNPSILATILQLLMGLHLSMMKMV